VTVDCSSGKKGHVYAGTLAYEVIEHHLDNIPDTQTKVMVNIGSPHEAFKNHYLPVQGVGLGRLEFIITSHIQIHPNALIEYQTFAESADEDHQRVAREIDARARSYEDKSRYYVDELAEGIGMIGAAFWPNEVIIRFSDFKTNEYRTLIGGEYYEPEENNPMIGWRGASRYYNEHFKQAFGLEVEAVKKVREEMGLRNVVVMVPFCRTVQEGHDVLWTMGEFGLAREHDPELKVYVMCEIPSNVIRADDFLEIFDGMSIGSNDLTQLALGMDRDSDIVAGISNENDPAVKDMISRTIERCHAHDKYVGICGQAPSDFPDFTAFLIAHGIDSVSLSPDTVIKTLPLIAEKEQEREAQ
jgi:pyruvate,water dikinase